MTDREKAIVMAYTGICMLEGKKLFEFYKYLEELYKRPVYTHEFLTLDMKERSEKDFMELCRKEEPERQTGEWIIDENAVLPFESGDCRCSVCGGGGCESYWNYCPHCGSLNGKIEGE